MFVGYLLISEMINEKMPLQLGLKTVEAGDVGSIWQCYLKHYEPDRMRVASDTNYTKTFEHFYDRADHFRTTI